MIIVESKEVIPEIQQRRFGAITVQGAILKKEFDNTIIILHFGGTNNIFANSLGGITNNLNLGLV